MQFCRLSKALLCGLASLGIFALALTACDGAGGNAASLFGVESTKIDTGYFVRIRVEYTIKETGDPFVVEWAQSCGAIKFSSPGTGSSYTVTQSPLYYFAATPDKKSAIALHSFAFCRDSSVEAVDPIYKPFLVWFDDANDLGFGFGYVSVAAYESPLAKVAHVKTTVTTITAEEWLAWRKQAAETYEQIGNLPGPWGYDGFKRDIERDKVLIARNGGAQYAIDSACVGYIRFKLPEAFFAKMRADWPDYAGQFWNLDPRDPQRREDAWPYSRKERGGVGQLDYGDRLDYADMRNGFNSPGTLIGVWHGNMDHRAVYKSKAPPPDRRVVLNEVYPLLPRSLSMENGLEIKEAQEAYAQNLLLAPEWNGFLACGWPGAVDYLRTKDAPLPHGVDLIRVYDPDLANRTTSLQVNGEEVFRYRGSGIPDEFVDKDGNYYTYN